MISAPSRLPEGRILAVVVDSDVRKPTYGNRAVQRARLAYYETCMNNSDSDIDLHVDGHPVLKRPAGTNEIAITEYGELLGFVHDAGGDDDNIRRLTVRIPDGLATRLEEHAGRRGMNAFIAEAIRERLQRVSRASARINGGNMDIDLLHAAQIDDGDAVARLIANGSDPDALEEDGKRALHLAAEQNAPAAIAALVRGGATVDAPDVVLSTPLFKACQMRAGAAAQALLDAGANLDRANEYGNTPIQAARKNHVQPVLEAVKQRDEAAAAGRASGADDDDDPLSSGPSSF